ncbi:hypothetical protein [Sphingobacterium endophyticum]|uniref:hypothetical protein n=1 Tax=Sphingobacterium endophyticum TaxID=2546448 RepID=UPI0012E11062|nr:hypothetical protein [Sphingobacterium endophyticum]
MMNSEENKKKNQLNDDDQGPKDPKDLAYDADDASYEFDVNDNDPDWDHPSDYDSVSEGAADDDSTYDSSNPYVGDEYASLEELKEEGLEDNNMHIEGDGIVKVSKLDEELSHDEEDDRDDLDEEGYPKYEG